MKKASAYTLFMIFAAFFLAGCRHNNTLQSRLDECDSLVWSDPAKAYGLLQGLHDSVYGYADEGMQMRYELIKTDALNKAKQPLTSDTTMKKVAAYFDDHKIIHQQVRAHYLLGRIYAEQKKPCEALQEFQQADDIADTTRTDCDWRQLALIHAQQTALYMFQQMNDLAIEECENAKYFALKAHDKAFYAQFVELEGNIYSIITDFVKSEKCYRKAYNIYKTISTKDAANTAGLLSFTLIDEGRYREAKRYMNEYERLSGQFHKDNADGSMHEYAYYKGMILLHDGKAQEAYEMFRCLFGHNRDDSIYAYNGLAQLYQSQGETGKALQAYLGKKCLIIP